MVALLERLGVEERREAWKRLGVEVDGDGDVLLVCGELVADLLVEPLDEGGGGMGGDPTEAPLGLGCPKMVAAWR